MKPKFVGAIARGIVVIATVTAYLIGADSLDNSWEWTTTERLIIGTEDAKGIRSRLAHCES